MYKINPRVASVLWQVVELFGTCGSFENFRTTVRMALRSGSIPKVKMMKAAYLRNFDHPAKSGRLDRSAERRMSFAKTPAGFGINDIAAVVSTSVLI